MVSIKTNSTPIDQQHLEPEADPRLDMATIESERYKIAGGSIGLSDECSVYSKAPVKLVVGIKRKTFFVFEDQIKTESTYVREALEIKREDDNYKEIYFTAEDDAAVEVFVNWLHSRK